jgi:hypothetical protein
MPEDYKSFNPYIEYRGLYDQIEMQKNTVYLNHKTHDSLEASVAKKQFEIEKLSSQNIVLGVSFLVLVLLVVLFRYIKFKR